MTRVIIQWNCNGYYTRFEDFKLLQKNYDPLAFLIQETHFRQNQNVALKGYNVFSAAAQSLPGSKAHGGAAIFLRDHLQAVSISLPQFSFQVVAIRTTLAQPITLCSVYMSPSAIVTRGELEQLIQLLPSPYLIAGDFNAHGPLWDQSRVSADSRGKDVEYLLQTYPLQLLNDGSVTHYSTRGSMSALDLSLTHPLITCDFAWSVSGDRRGSDHHPIFIDYIPQVGTNEVPPRWRIDTADWDAYQRAFPSPPALPTSVAHIDASVAHFERLVLDAGRVAVKRTSPTHVQEKKKTVPWWSDDCAGAVKLRKRLYHVFKTNPTLDNLCALKRQEAVTKRILRAARRASWAEYVSTLNSSSAITEVWAKVRRIRGRPSGSLSPLLVNGATYFHPADIAEQLACQFSGVASDDEMDLQSRLEKHKWEELATNFTGGDAEPYNDPFLLAELQEALKPCKNTAPGPDQIPYSFLQHLPATYMAYLLALYNCIWACQYVPDTWRHAIIVPILKPGKEPSSPSSYRPISLTNTLMKILERMVNKRLVWFLDTHSLIADIQCGSRRGRSAVDHLVRVSTYIQDGFVLRQHTVGLLFDIKSAYDRTWRPVILQQLQKWGMRGNLPLFIQQFLKKRTMSVRCGTTLSSPKLLDNGTPQGSVLSCTLFLIAINTVTVHLPSSLLSCLYIDDLGIFYRAATLSAIEDALMPVLRALEQWSRETGFLFSPEKTAVVHFCRKRCSDDLTLSLNGSTLTTVTSHKFLGLIFDRKLTWTNHLVNLRARAYRALNLLKVVSARHWGADRRTLIMLYRALVRSRLDYGSVVYSSANPRLLKSLDTVQNEALRISTGAFKSSPIMSLCVEADEPPLSIRRTRLLLHYCASRAHTPSHPAYPYIFTTAYHNRYNRRPHSSKPIHFRYHTKLLELDVHPPTVQPLPPSPALPPWKRPPVDFNLSLSELSKQTTPPHIYMKAFHAVMSRHPPADWTHYYTDGSRLQGRVGCAFVLRDEAYLFPLLPHCSIYSAELFAIFQCIENILTHNVPKSLIISDSLSALQGLQTVTTPSPIISLIRSKMCQLPPGHLVQFCWVPSHTGIPGNTLADEAAKMATSTPSAPWPLTTPQDLKNILTDAVKSQWQSEWNDPNLASNKLKSVKPRIGWWLSAHRSTRREEVLLARLRIGHTHLTHSYLMSRDPQPECPTCNTALTVSHILLSCSTYDTPRTALPSPHTLSHLLGDNEPILIQLLTFLRSTPYLHSL